MLCTQMTDNSVVIVVIKILFAWKRRDFLVFRRTYSVLCVLLNFICWWLEWRAFQSPTTHCPELPVKFIRSFSFHSYFISPNDRSLETKLASQIFWKFNSNHKIDWLVESRLFARRLSVQDMIFSRHWSRNCFSRSLMSICQVEILLTEKSRLVFYIPLDLCDTVNVIILQNRPLNAPVNFWIRPFEFMTMPTFNRPSQFSTFWQKLQKAFEILIREKKSQSGT